MNLPSLTSSDALKSGADVSARFDASGWNVATGGGSNGLPTWAIIAALAVGAVFLLKKRG